MAVFLVQMQDASSTPSRGVELLSEWEELAYQRIGIIRGFYSGGVSL